MSIGTGIAIGGIWAFAAACAVGRRVTGLGMLIAIIAALTATGIVAR